MRSNKRIRYILRLKEDLKKFQAREIEFIPTGKDYEKELGINERSAIRWIKKDLTNEEKILRKTAMDSRINGWFDRLSEEKKQKRREISSKTMKANLTKSYEAEETIKNKLKKEGWKVERFYKSEDINKEQNRIKSLLKQLKRVLKGEPKPIPEFRKVFRYKELKKFIKGTGNEGLLDFLYDLAINKTELIQIDVQGKVNYNYKKGCFLPDFICKKGKTLKFVEVKSYKCKIEDTAQSETLRKLSKKGFEIELYNVS